MNAGQKRAAAMLFGFGGNLAVRVSVPSVAVRWSLQVNGDMPVGVVASWSTTAPPGITINQAWTANGDVSSAGIADGFTAEDFWRGQRHRRVGRIDARAGPELVQHRARGQPEHQQPDLRHPDPSAHRRGSALGRLLPALAQPCPRSASPGSSLARNWRTRRPIRLAGQAHRCGQTGSWVWNPPDDFRGQVTLFTPATFQASASLRKRRSRTMGRAERSF